MFKKTKAPDATADALSIVVLHESFLWVGKNGKDYSTIFVCLYNVFSDTNISQDSSSLC